MALIQSILEGLRAEDLCLRNIARREVCVFCNLNLQLQYVVRSARQSVQHAVRMVPMMVLFPTLFAQIKVREEPSY